MNALLLVLAVSSFSPPPREDDAKRASKSGKLTGQIDGVDVLATYGRPQVKGRKVFGDLIPFGEVWRAGADEATVIVFEKDVQVEGKKLAAGVYSFFAIPGADEWTIIFNKEPKQWGAYKYDASKDALRVKVKPKKAETTEVLTFKISGTGLELRFDTVVVPVAIKKA